MIVTFLAALTIGAIFGALLIVNEKIAWIAALTAIIAVGLTALLMHLSPTHYVITVASEDILSGFMGLYLGEVAGMGLMYKILE